MTVSPAAISAAAKPHARNSCVSPANMIAAPSTATIPSASATPIALSVCAACASIPAGTDGDYLVHSTPSTENIIPRPPSPSKLGLIRVNPMEASAVYMWLAVLWEAMKQAGICGAILVAAGLLLIGFGTVGIALGEPAADTESMTATDFESGEQFAGAVGVQQAAVDGGFESQRFDRQFQRAADDDERAQRIGEQLNRADSRLADLEERRDELADARDRGEISQGQYQARTAQLSAELAQLERSMGQTDRAAEGVSAAALERSGVDSEAIDRVRSNASELRSGEIAKTAREIAGPPADRGSNSQPPGINRIDTESDSPTTDRSEHDQPTGEQSDDSTDDGDDRERTDGDNRERTSSDRP